MRQFQFARAGTKVHRLAPIDGPNMPNLGHRSKKIYGSILSLDALHDYARSSAVDACQTGFRPMVVPEAVGDRSQSAHDQSLFGLDEKYADVVSLAECGHGRRE